MISYTCKNDVEFQLIEKVFNFLKIKISVHNTISYNFKIYYVRKEETANCTSIYQFIYLLGEHYDRNMTPYLYCKDAVKLCTKIFNKKIINNGNYVVLDDCNTPKELSSYTTKYSFNNIDNSDPHTPRVECTDINEFVDFYNWLYKTDYKVTDMDNNKMPELKPGYIVEINDDLFLLFENSKGQLCYMRVSPDNSLMNWDVIENFSILFKDSITAIYETGNTTLKDKCIWEKPKETVLTMQEIADKFGVDVNILKIKK